MEENERIRFVVFGQGRTGSRLLVELLRSHPNIACDDEILNGCNWSAPARRCILPFWRFYPVPLFRHRARGSPRRAYGFKLFDDHLYRPGFVLRCLHRLGWRIVHVQRRDLVAQAFSTALARRTSRWHRRSGDSPESPTLRIGVEPFLRILRERERRAARIDRLLADLPHLDIVYEDDLADRARWPSTSRRIAGFLGLPAHTLDTDMVKTWERPCRDMVEDYDELLDAARREGHGLLPDDAPRNVRDGA